MVAFNFSPEHVAKVVSGEKRQTIRRTKHGKVGDLCQLYTGQRGKHCRKLVDPDPVLDLIDYVAIRPSYLTLGNTVNHPRDADAFARLDGFNDYADMVAWFSAKYGSPFFTGYLHRWRPAHPTRGE